MNVAHYLSRSSVSTGLAFVAASNARLAHRIGKHALKNVMAINDRETWARRLSWRLAAEAAKRSGCNNGPGVHSTVSRMVRMAGDAAEELRGLAQRIVTAFQQKYIRAGARPGTPLVLSREFASEFLAGERGHGLETDEEALDLRAAIEAVVNEGEELEDTREEEAGPGYPREWYPSVADLGDWYSDSGWLAICDGEAA